jgi:hypothetical protein
MKNTKHNHTKEMLLAIGILATAQLMSCASASQSELLSMINQGQAIEIEVATPINEEQGTEQSLDWEQLALLTTNPDLRKSMDDILMISNTDTGKNGVLYVNSDGENEPNNTLRVALHNREFVKFLEDDSSLSELAEAAADNYVDVEADVDDLQKAVYMGINGYFNLLPDSSPNYANPDSTIQRNEFMAMVFRAETPVQDLEADSTFATAVGTSDYNLYAQGVVDSSYLDLASQSLNNMTYNGTITRAEAIYLLVTRYFADDYANLDLKSDSTTFTDAKDGGNIAEDQKFIEDATEKSYWKSYELTYALQNPDKGLPTDLYKALVVASNKGLISAETRWDEGLTKSEAIELLVETLEQEQGIDIFNAKQGTIEGYEAPADQDQSDTTSDDTTGVDSTSTNIELDEDEYQGDDEEETTDSTEITRTSGYRTDEEVLDYYKKQYEAGEIDKDTYDWIVEVYSEPSEAIEEIKNAMNSSSSSSEPDVIMPEGAMQGTPDNGIIPEYHLGQSGSDSSLYGDYVE